MSEYMNVSQAAEVLGVSRRTIWRLIHSGTLPAIANPIDHRGKLIRRNAVEQLVLYTRKSAHPTEVASSGAHRQGQRPQPTIIGAADLGVRSDEVDEWLEANWRPC